MEELNPNFETLARAARALEPILGEIVFVGGTIAGLLVNDPGASPVRPTKDVDVVAQIAGGEGYAWATSKMLKLGFQPDRSEGAPTCRWVKDGVLVDLMGSAGSAFGQSNPWYTEGFASRAEHRLTGAPRIFILSAPVFLLTKWEAYLDRGRSDMVASHDIEDILNVLDGRTTIRDEGKGASVPVQEGLRVMAEAMLDSQAFVEGCLASLGGRDVVVREHLESFAGRAGKPLPQPPKPRVSRLMGALAMEAEKKAKVEDILFKRQADALRALEELYAEVRSVFLGVEASGVKISQALVRAALMEGRTFDAPTMTIILPDGRSAELRPEGFVFGGFKVEILFRGGVDNRPQTLLRSGPSEDQQKWSFFQKGQIHPTFRPWSLDEFEELLESRLLGKQVQRPQG